MLSGRLGRKSKAKATARDSRGNVGLSLMLVGQERSCSAKNFLIHVFVKTDDQRFPFSQGRSAQVAGGAQHYFFELCLIWLVLFYINVNDRFSSGGIDVIGLGR